MEKYNTSVDMWSIGCVLAEILLLKKSKESNIELKLEDMFIFPGSSCFPFSPISKDTDFIDSKDQLVKILEILG